MTATCALLLRRTPGTLPFTESACQVGKRLHVVGELGGIAANEVLYSVRFMGERAFFVTFRKVDPLFAVDLSDPTDPALLGELHVPGYSDYLQPIDEDHLLAIGRGANESTGLFEELQVSIFDVSDMVNPQLLHRYSFDAGRSTATPAIGDRWQRGDGDHHAVGYYPADQIFTLPIYSADQFASLWNGLDNTPQFALGNGCLQVFRIDVDSGFTPLGLIEHDTLVERSVRVGDHLYAISSGAISVHELTNPDIELGRIDIGASADQLVELTMYSALANQLVLASGQARGAFAPPRTGDWLSSSKRPNDVLAARAAAFARVPLA